MLDSPSKNNAGQIMADQHDEALIQGLDGSKIVEIFTEEVESG